MQYVKRDTWTAVKDKMSSNKVTVKHRVTAKSVEIRLLMDSRIRHQRW